MSTIVDTIYGDNEQILKFLEEKREPSFQSDLDNKLKKIILLSAASFFEQEITRILEKYIKKGVNDNEPIYAFVQSKAIDGQYYKFFDWSEKNKNATQFFKLFGEEFKNEVNKEIKEKGLEDSVKAFLDIGRDRNYLVHNNFASYHLEKTSEEYYDLYKEAIKFIIFLEDKFL